MSVVGLPGIGFLFGFALALGLLAFSFIVFGLFADWLRKNVCQGNGVLEDVFSGLPERDVVAHLHSDVPWKGIPGFLDIRKSLGVLAGQLDEPVDVGVDGVLGRDLYKYPGPPDSFKGVKDHHHGLWIQVFLFLMDQSDLGVEHQGFVGSVFLGSGVN